MRGKPGRSADENPGKIAEKALNRQELLTALQTVLDASFEKMSNKYTKNVERQGWARLIIAAASASNDVLKDIDLDDIARRLEVLEAIAKQREGNKH